MVPVRFESCWDETTLGSEESKIARASATSLVPGSGMWCLLWPFARTCWPSEIPRAFSLLVGSLLLPKIPATSGRIRKTMTRVEVSCLAVFFSLA